MCSTSTYDAMTSMLYGKRRELPDGSVNHWREFVTRVFNIAIKRRGLWSSWKARVPSGCLLNANFRNSTQSFATAMGGILVSRGNSIGTEYGHPRPLWANVPHSFRALEVPLGDC
jgi:hypothetical protein